MDSLLIAAIDFGTTYSSWAFSKKADYLRDPLCIFAKQWLGGHDIACKGPTCVLIEPDGKTFNSFGFEAENKYVELVFDKKHTDWYFFKRFKLLLFGQKGIDRNIMIEDITGQKRLPAKRVFALAIKFLKDDLMSACSKTVSDGISNSDIHWVLTVPAIWNDAAKQFMREAAQDAGISGNALSICLEPEAASVYCRHLPVEKNVGKETSLSAFQAGTKYMILDAGGGTVDISVHEVLPCGNLRELHKASGGVWGGTKVDEAFETLLENVFGQSVVAEFKNQHLEDYIGLFRDFEMKKRELSQAKSSQMTLRFPLTFFNLVLSTHGCPVKDYIQKSKFKDMLQVLNDKIRFELRVAKSCFTGTILSIVNHVEKLLNEPSLASCSAIVMVGGFSECLMLQENIEDRFGDRKIIIPRDAGLAVLKGAVIFGRKPNIIVERICKYTYGCDTAHNTSPNCKHPKGRQLFSKKGEKLCCDIFKIHAHINQPVKIGEEGEEIVSIPVNDDQTAITWDIYASTEPNPYFVTDPGCTMIGTLRVPIADTSLGCKRSFGASFKFGGTEIEVKVVDKVNGQSTIKRIDFLG